MVMGEDARRTICMKWAERSELAMMMMMIPKVVGGWVGAPQQNCAPPFVILWAGRTLEHLGKQASRQAG
jgi:hypothetical protein